MEHIIRHYKDDDLPDVLSAWESASRFSHPFLSNDFFENERYNIPNFYLPNADIWVVEHNGKVIGFIALFGNKVCAVFVKPEFHGTGAGRALMDKAQELHGNLEVDVFKKNSIGCKFYSSYGFKSAGKKFHKETGHVILKLKFTAKKHNKDKS
ncbi:MAG: GNAT family N-acetyltransferase [Gammaproteobacteria bacterium]|nr:MAG: GNAT family N-acetyltransferase [Gammaproteobacteria bacterium]